MTIYKRCRECHELFPSHILNINSYCPKHQNHFKRFLSRCIVNRGINIDVLDVFDKEGKRLCRSCGRVMYNKNGKRSLAKMNCHQKDCGNLADEFPYHYWLPYVNNSIVYERKISKSEIKCEDCGKVMEIGSHYEVHHKKPVYKTTIENWEDVWDPDNLIVLCLDCHNKTKVYKVIEVDRTRKHLTLDSFLS